MTKSLIKSILLTLISIIFLTNCTRGAFERGGWIDPKAQKSKFIEVKAGGFNVANTKDGIEFKYMVGVKLDPKRPNSNWLIAEFEDPKNKSFTRKSFQLKPEQNYFHFYSDSVCGLRDYSSYLVKISLSSDKEGKNITDSLNQYIRLANMGLVMRNYKHC